MPKENQVALYARIHSLFLIEISRCCAGTLCIIHRRDDCAFLLLLVLWELVTRLDLSSQLAQLATGQPEERQKQQYCACFNLWLCCLLFAKMQNALWELIT